MPPNKPLPIFSVTHKLKGKARSQIHTAEAAGAVLDIQWQPDDPLDGEEKNVLAVATSVGKIEFFKLRIPELGTTSDASLERSQLHQTTQVADPAVLVLSIAWSPFRDYLGFTLSDGRVCIYNVHAPASDTSSESSKRDIVTGMPTYIHEIYTHSLEAWTLAFSAPSSSAINIFSGGDDAILSCSTLQIPTNPETTEQTPTHQQSWLDHGRSHMAGVTAILPLNENLILTGSYDDRIRLFSLSSAPKPATLITEMDLGGGVWRLKVLEQIFTQDRRHSVGYIILASCMHAGSRIVHLVRGDSIEAPVGGESVNAGEWRFEVLAKFEEHQSMNYGSDCQPKEAVKSEEVCQDERGGMRTIVSTSFYDKLLCLWRIDLGRMEAG